MSIKEENLIKYDGTILPGQRFAKIGNKLMPVGIGGAFEPGSGSGSEMSGYVVVEEDGVLKAQKLTFDGTTAIPSGEAEIITDTGLFPTGMEEPDYAGSGGGSSEGTTMKFYQCVSVDTTAKTWTGYELILEDGKYTVSTTLTEGLMYTTMIPDVGVVYTEDALVKVASYAQKIPVDGMVLYAPLSADSATTETGQTITKNGEPTYQVIDDISCVYVNQYSNSLTISSEGVPAGDSPATWSLWVKEISNTGGEADGHLLSLKDSAAIGGISYVQGISFNGKSSGKLAAGVYSASSDSWVYSDDSLDSGWHHIVMTRDAEGLCCLYLDGVKKAEKTIAEAHYISNGSFLALGYLAYYSGWGASGYVSNIRIYTRVLSQDEITTLASEFIPTE